MKWFKKPSVPTAEEYDKEENERIEEIKRSFDKKYKIIIKYYYFEDEAQDYKMWEWLNNNTIGSVDIKLSNTRKNWFYFVGFENEDDYLVFKIKYSPQVR